MRKAGPWRMEAIDEAFYLAVVADVQNAIVVIVEDLDTVACIVDGLIHLEFRYRSVDWQADTVAYDARSAALEIREPGQPSGAAVRIGRHSGAAVGTRKMHRRLALLV